MASSGDTAAASPDPVTESLADVLNSLQTSTESIADSLSSASTSLDALTDAMAAQAVADSVAGSAALGSGGLPALSDSVTDPVRTITDSEVSTMGDTLQQTTGSLQQAVDDPVQTVNNTVQQAVDNPVQAVNNPVQAVNNTVQQAVDNPVQTVNNTVQQAVDDPVQTVNNTVQQANNTVQQAVDNPVQTVGNATQSVANATQPVTNAANEVVGTATHTGSSIVNGSTASVGSAVDQVVGHGGAALAGAGQALSGSAGQLGGATSPLSDRVATMLASPVAPGTAGDTTSLAPIQLPEHPTTLLAPLSGGGEPVSGSGGILDVAPFGGPDLLAGAEEVVILSAVAVTAASFALAARPSAVIGAQFFLANVRQMPVTCGAFMDGVGRQVSAAVSETARLGSLAASAPERAIAGVEAAAHAVREGFSEALERGPGSAIPDDGDRANDVRLLMQIGMLLGTLYVAFLTVWFWATRLRWSPRT